MKRFKSLYTIFYRFVGTGFLFLLTFIIVKFFPSDKVGEFEYFRSLLLLLTSINALGLDFSILSFSGKIHAENSLGSFRDLYQKSMRLVLTGFVVIAFFLLLFYLIPNPIFHNEVHRNAIIWTILLLLFTTIYAVNTEFIRGLNKDLMSETFRSLLKNLPLLLAVLALIYFEKFNGLIPTFTWITLAITALSFLAIYYYMYSSKNILNEKQTITFCPKNIFLNSYPTAISVFCFFLLATIDVFYIEYFISIKHVAYYALVSKFILIISTVNTAVNFSVGTQISQYYHQKDYVNLKKVIRKSYYTIALINVAFNIFFCFGIQFFFHFFNPEYSISKDLLYIMFVGHSVLSSFFGVLPIYMLMTQKQKIFQVILVLSVFISLVLNYFLIQQYGIKGVAYNFIIVALFWNVLSLIYIYQKDKIWVILFR